jgi:hypothetical protein
MSHSLAPSSWGILAPTPDFGPCRKVIGPTKLVRPIVVRLLGEMQGLARHTHSGAQAFLRLLRFLYNEKTDQGKTVFLKCEGIA